jgi:hypothetical protein
MSYDGNIHLPKKIKPRIRAMSKIKYVYGNTPSSLTLTLNSVRVQ